MERKIKVTVTMEVTIPQALALQAMFEYWNELGDKGSSRTVSFFVDGDGNFQPNCKFSSDEEIPALTDRIRKAAASGYFDGNRNYDFDSIAYLLTR